MTLDQGVALFKDAQVAKKKTDLKVGVVKAVQNSPIIQPTTLVALS